MLILHPGVVSRFSEVNAVIAQNGGRTNTTRTLRLQALEVLAH